MSKKYCPRCDKMVTPTKAITPLWYVLGFLTAGLAFIILLFKPWRCPNCHGTKLHTHPYKMPKAKDYFCRYCGAQNKDDAAYCERCGRKLVD